MKVAQAIGIFSDINSEEYNHKEKAEAIYIVMQKNRVHDIKKEDMNDVIKWLWNRCFRITKSNGESSKME